jgi:energy-coupling factor transport system permease protein
LLTALFDGMRLFAVLACVGAANSLADPRRLLKSVPGALYEVGVAVVVALSVTPSLLVELHEVRQARRLRGRADRGMRGAAGAALPVLGAALERSVALAAAMDSRGYGRTSHRESRRLPGVLTVVGLIGVLLGTYGLLDAGSPGLLGLPLLLVGTATAIGGLAAGHRDNPRTRYRPDPWGAPEWAVSLAGLIPAFVLTAAAIQGLSALTGPASPPGWPVLPLLPAVAILLAAAPAWLAPAPGVADLRPAAAWEAVA